MLTIEKSDIGDDLFAIEERVKEVYKQILIGLGTKDALKTEIGKQTDVTFFYLCHNDV